MTPERADRSSNPAGALAGAKSVICLGMAYWSGHRTSPMESRGKVARYAWGDDYHTVIGERLDQLAALLRAEFGAEYRWFVDTGPIMDKALAARSGLGWYGKNTNLLTEPFGSFVLLGEIITSLDLSLDEPMHRDCGSCRLCVVACPTGALGPDYTIDATRCISYLTIEHRAAIPVDLRAAMGSWVFGCDICQDVCPPTMAPYLKSGEERRAWAGEVRRTIGSDPVSPSSTQLEYSPSGADAASSHPLFERPIRQTLDLIWLLHLTHAQYLEAFRGTAIKRAKVWMLRRNAAVALGNVGDERCVGRLSVALNEDEHPVVRGHAAWALGQIAVRTGAPEAIDALGVALTREQDAGVIEEIVAARALFSPAPEPNTEGPL